MVRNPKTPGAESARGTGAQPVGRRVAVLAGELNERGVSRHLDLGHANGVRFGRVPGEDPQPPPRVS